MDTIIINPNKKEEMITAAEIIKNGGTVVMPTETVYGLATDALDPTAVEKIFMAKGRPSDNPLIIHISSLEEIDSLVAHMGEKAKKLAEKFWPGPLTMIFKKTDLVPSITSGGLDTVAIRIPENEVARQLIDLSGKPLAAPSANVSGSPSPTKFSHVLKDMAGRVNAIIDGEDCAVGLESTVISMVEDVPKILRPGAITPEDIAYIIGEVEVDESITLGLDSTKEALSPGMKYKHYAPKTKVVVAHVSKEEYLKKLKENKELGALCFDGDLDYIENKKVSFGDEYNPLSQAEKLFSALHKIDDLGVKKVLARAPRLSGVGLAVYNRLIRAAGFNCIFSDVNIVGLTGQTGSGKSYVGKILEELGAYVIDCDKVTKEDDIYPEECLKLLQKTFSYDIINCMGKLDRRKLGSYAFSSKDSTKKLNEIVLPYIIARISDIIKKAVQDGKKMIILDAPTLFEAKADELCDKIIVAKADVDLRLARIIKRDDLSVEDAKKRMNAQKEEKFYTDLADFIIDTENTESVKEQVQEIFNKLSHYRK